MSRGELSGAMLRGAVAILGTVAEGIFRVGDAIVRLASRFEPTPEDGWIAGLAIEDPWDLLTLEARDNLRVALSVIDATAPWYLARLRRHRGLIAVAPLAGQSRATDDGNLLLDAADVAQFPPAHLATMLVVLVTSLRLKRATRRRWPARQREWTPDARAQAYRRMYREGRWFAERLAAGPALVEWVDEWLSGLVPGPAAVLAQRERSLAALGAPSWVVRVHRRLWGGPSQSAT